MKTFTLLLIIFFNSQSFAQNIPAGGGDATIGAGNSLKVFTNSNGVTGVKLFGNGGTWDTNWGPGFLQLYGSYIYDNGTSNLHFANGAHAISIHSGDPNSAVGISLNAASSSYFNNSLAIGGSNGPLHTLHVIGDGKMNSYIDQAQLGITGRTDNQKRLIIGLDTTGNGFGFIKVGRFNVAYTNLALQPNGGSVSIGTIAPKGYAFAVNGNMVATSITVKTNANWPDYVFHNDYRLPTLSEVKNYIDKNHHLPEMPSAQEVEKEGLNLGEMNKLLLKKVEELTLHLIEKEDQLKNLTKRIERIEKTTTPKE